MRRLVVNTLQLFGEVKQRAQIHVWIAMFRGPDNALRTASAREPDGRMGFLHRHNPRIGHTVREMPTFPAERARGRPALEDQIVGFFKALTVFRGADSGM